MSLEWCCWSFFSFSKAFKSNAYNAPVVVPNAAKNNAKCQLIPHGEVNIFPVEDIVLSIVAHAIVAVIAPPKIWREE